LEGKGFRHRTVILFMKSSEKDAVGKRSGVERQRRMEKGG